MDEITGYKKKDIYRGQPSIVPAVVVCPECKTELHCKSLITHCPCKMIINCTEYRTSLEPQKIIMVFISFEKQVEWNR